MSYGKVEPKRYYECHLGTGPEQELMHALHL